MDINLNCIRCDELLSAHVAGVRCCCGCRNGAAHTGGLEAPTLRPIGNLKDLLAGNGSQCDAGVFESGTTAPPGEC